MRLDLKAFAGFILACSLFQSGSVNATVVFSTFDSGNTYQCCDGWTVGGPTSIVGQISSAEGFTSPGDYSIGQIDLGLSNVGGTNSASVSLWTDLGGFPGAQLGSWSLSGLPALGSTNNTLETISGITGVNLISGDSYFLVIDAGTDTWDAWNQTGTTGLLLQSLDGDATWGSFSNSAFGAFDIVTTDVPEPATLAFFGAGLLGLAGLRRRRKAT